MKEKRGLSPVIATVLLVSISLVLAVIIFVWAKSFVAEQALKFGSPVEFSCENVNFDADILVSEREIAVVNRGNVPLFGVEIRQKEARGIKILKTFEGQTISVGQSKTIGLDTAVDSAEEFVVVPIILGESGDETKAFTCDEEFGITANVIAI